MYIYLDESGNLTGKNGEYFIIGTYTIGNPKRIENAFRRWQRRKFPKKLKGKTEIKFNNSAIDDKLRHKTLKFFASQDIRIFYAYLKRKNIPQEYRKKGKVHHTGQLYAEIVRATLELYLPIDEPQVIVVRDQKSLKGMGVQQFHEMLKVSLLPKLPPKTQFYAYAVDSTTSPPVQVADWICGALARYYEKKLLGEKFYAVLKRNIVNERELFSEYWAKRWE